jgi:hypothetical protein
MHASNGILFNHESPRRGETFVTRKITRAVARIAAGIDKEVYLGNLDAVRDWGYAKEYVEAMWLMLQQPKGDDFVIATGESATVRQFAEVAFKKANLNWEDHVKLDKRYLRPSEVDSLVGDASKAEKILSWKAKTNWKKLAELMVDADIQLLDDKLSGRKIDDEEVIDNKQVCVIVPFYNEEEVIEKVLTELIANNYQVLAVDDGSTDKSNEIARKMNCLLLKHPSNFGQGAALQTGISFARLNPKIKYFVTFDSDGQHQVSNINYVLKPLVNGETDFVFGTRFQDDKTKFPFLKRIVLKAAIKYTQLSTGVAITDTHNGFRAFNKLAANKINLNFSGMTHASEFVEKAGQSGLRIKEVPVHILYTKYTKRKGQSLWNSINILTDLFLR